MGVAAEEVVSVFMGVAVEEVDSVFMGVAAEEVDNKIYWNLKDNSKRCISNF